MFSSPRGRRRLLWVLLGGAVLVVGVVAALVVFSREGNVSNSDVEFGTAAPTAPATVPEKAPKANRHPFDDGFTWPMYGFTRARTRFLPLDRQLRPPFVQRWRVRGNALLEFNPVLCRRSVFLLTDNAAVYAISRQTGRVSWRRDLGSLAAASPACGRGTIYAVVLSRGRGAPGRVAALSTKDGRTRWSRKLPSRAESSPLLDRGRLYFGTEDGTVYALRARDGAIRWRYRAPGAVKGAVAADDGKLFFGTYGGRVVAIRQSNGRQVWSTNAAGGGALGVGGGNFYATPAVAYDRVYIGSTNGFVYSFSTRNGALAWRHRTGAFVYSSAAVSPARGGTVYVGSHDSRLYAFNARTGAVRWTHRAQGRISGGPTVIGDLVFYSELGTRSTTAVGARTGRPVWKTRRGGYNPVISDGRRLYLNGYASLYMFSTPRQRRLDRRARLAYRRSQREHRRPAARPRPGKQRGRKRKARTHITRAHLRKLLGHRHSGRGAPPRCHRHRHRIRRRGRTIVYAHSHCHRHLPGRRMKRRAR